MKFHLDFPINLNSKPEHSSLYQWGLVELVPDNKSSGDLIPWSWSFGFTATECTFTNGFAIEPPPFTRGKEGGSATIEVRQTIRARLHSGIDRDRGNWSKTRFSMLGTSRNIENIWLNIYATSDEISVDLPEVCEAWGCLSYTHELDFRKITEEDFILFSLYVKPSTFGRFAEQIKAGMVDEITFVVADVAGFYSGWSPSISTNFVKVLTSDREHPIEGSEQNEIKPPRLGRVGQCTLSLNRKMSFSLTNKPALFDTLGEPMRRLSENNMAPAPAALADPQSQKLLASIRTAAWWVVALLAVLAVKAWR